MRRAGLDPLIPYPGAQKPWLCRCLECGVEVTPQYANVRLGQGGCKWCARVSEADAVEKMRAAGLEPQEPYPGMRGLWSCRCVTCGETITPRLHHIIAGSRGCKWCAKKAVDAEAAAAIMRQAGLVALVRYPGSGEPWSCRCTRCNSVVTPQYGMVRLGRGGCGVCVRRGFDATRPAVVYVVTHAALGAVKVGIGRADGGRRLDMHGKYGWETVAVIRTSGESAKRIERDILHWWRKDLSLPSYLCSEDMPQGGWTETAELDAVNIPETVRRIEALVRTAE